MKKIYNYTFKMVCLYIIVLSMFSVFNIEITTNHYNSNIKNANEDKVINSILLVQNQEKLEITKEESESIKDVEKEEDSNSTEKENVIIETPPKKEEVVNIVDTSSYAVLSYETVNISHYGHDCYGCTTGYTASGYYVGDGRIYYQDPTYGSVRVVAADRKYPIGTILRLGYNGSKVTAIVLDRGGAIGDGKRFQIDLLASSNSEAYKLGIVNNTSLEVLRYGY